MEEQKPVNKPAVAQDSNLMAALSYVSILSVVMLVIKKDDEFVKFHAKQGTVLFLITIVAYLLSSFVLYFLGPIIYLLVGIACVIGFIKALGGERYTMPVIGDIATKIHV